ncbi:hypothetical protein SAMN05421595_2295 [Austwickia chelonae]|uniref:Uncharacterized protein n=1 Tax=Austwickia chelonae NBRC 105200 TaxID=1184607 RepID=K6W9Y2_9MICO|nr:hypothetical protein [Austwickia chelonae]GAB78642.1 hypothetical protein AUCHE_16_00600 [Austwickia chelonae NBRC 105200]SEW34314.1 hypothetical protein SAMN05421595_2295 [Austwickia chelonae]
MSSRKVGDRIITSALIAVGVSFLTFYAAFNGRGLWSALVLFLCSWPAVYLMMAVGDSISHALAHRFPGRRTHHHPR